MTVKTRRVQILLRDDIPIHKAMIEHLERMGKRSSLPMEWLIAGYEAFYNGSAPTSSGRRADPIDVQDADKEDSKMGILKGFLQ